ncbi:MAG TPA: (Fe-S)-binding protein [Burkholderiaceae bacterium]|nr:(Fe-S)-binding protein [Burkholderiaceae bacterium]
MTTRSRVGLLVTCLVDVMRPDIGFSALKLIEHAGYDVVVPPQQTCCGQPGYNSGDTPSARALAAKVLREFAEFAYVVVPSGSCAGMVRKHYVDLFNDDPPLKQAALDLASRTYELTEFLVDVAQLRTLPDGRPFQGHVTYHDSCSGLRELGVKRQPRELLSLVPGLRLTEMAGCEACCGFGGTFAVKYGEISTAIVDEKCTNIRESGADAVVLGDLGCILNIEGRLRRTGDERTRVVHVAQLLTGDM